MGTWASGLYGNDTTCDVRDAYVGLLRDQVGDDEAYAVMLERFAEYMGDQDEPLFWYALADTQWRAGRLYPEVKARALWWISRAGGLAAWVESVSRGAGWRKTVGRLKVELESPMPARRVFRRPVECARNPWEVGDVYAYQFHTEIARERGLDGWYIPLQKIGHTEYCDGWLLSTIQVYDKVFDQVPALDDLAGVRILPLGPAPGVGGARPAYYTTEDWFGRQLAAYMIYGKRSDYPEAHLKYIGNQSRPDAWFAGNRVGGCYWDRDNMDDWLTHFYLAWRGVAYPYDDARPQSTPSDRPPDDGCDTDDPETILRSLIGLGPRPSL